MARRGAGHGIRSARRRPASRAGRSRHLALPVHFALAILLGIAACDLPKDPERTLERARGGTLRVGAVDSPPWLVRSGDQGTGPEAELVEALAAALGAEIDWRWGSLDSHHSALERFQLDVVAAGLTDATPGRKKVGFTRPWRVEGETRHVLAVPPGENAALMALERVIEARRAGAR
jgi:hypothetical protein